MQLCFGNSYYELFRNNYYFPLSPSTADGRPAAGGTVEEERRDATAAAAAVVNVDVYGQKLPVQVDVHQRAAAVRLTPDVLAYLRRSGKYENAVVYIVKCFTCKSVQDCVMKPS